MISAVPQPSAVAKITLARHTCFCGALRSATIASSRRRSARVTLTTIPALIMRAWTASADLGIVRMNQTTRGDRCSVAALDSAQVVVRGPKPATVLHSRKVRIDRAANDPFTTHEVLIEMHGTPLRGKRVVVQRYGETNRELQAELESEGADVTEIVTYRWTLPEDTAPLLRLIGALGRDEIDLVAFTSASQASNLFTVAQYDGKEASLKQSLGRTLVASIGPVCSVALRKLAVRVDIEAKPPKLGPFMDAINAVLSDPRRLG